MATIEMTDEFLIRATEAVANAEHCVAGQWAVAEQGLYTTADHKFLYGTAVALRELFDVLSLAQVQEGGE